MVANSSSIRSDVKGFTAEVTRSEARRQLRLSVGLVGMLAVGIVSAAFAVGTHPIAAKRDVVSSQPLVTEHAEANPVGARAI